jgi:hypothetical protein
VKESDYQPSKVYPKRAPNRKNKRKINNLPKSSEGLGLRRRLGLVSSERLGIGLRESLEDGSR